MQSFAGLHSSTTHPNFTSNRELVGARPLHLACARPFGRLKAPLGLSLLRCARKRELSLDVLGEGQSILPCVFQQELTELLLRNRRFQIILAPADIKITA